MVFSSLTFLFLYLPLTLLVYFLSPLRWRNFVLLVVSLLFYGWGEPVYIVIMFLSIIIDYTHGLPEVGVRQGLEDLGMGALAVIVSETVHCDLPPFSL